MRYSEKSDTGADTIPRWATVIIILLVGLLLNVTVFEIRFLYDDISLIVTNPFIRETRGMLDFLTAGRPVRTLTFFIDYHLWGHNPRGFHITNLLLHLGAAVIWFRFLEKWFVGRWTAFGAALFFVIHPAGAEALAVVSHRKEMLAFIFLAASLWSYLAASRRGLCDEEGERSRPKLKFYLLSWFFFLLGLGSKQVVIILPVLAFISDILISGLDIRRILRLRVGLYLPYLLVPVLFMVLSLGDWRIFGYIPAEQLFGEFHLKVLAISGWSVTAYLRMLVWPIFFSADHQVVFPSVFMAVLGLILWVGMIAVAWMLRKRNVTIALGLGWMAFNLAVVLNLIPANQPLADRYLYIPMAGFCLFLVGLISRADIWKFPLRGIVIFLGLFLITLVALNYGWDYMYHETLPVTAGVVVTCLISVAVEAGAMRLSDRVAGSSRLWRGIVLAGLCFAILGAFLIGMNIIRSLMRDEIPWFGLTIIVWMISIGVLWALYRRMRQKGGASKFFRLVIFSAAAIFAAIWIGTVTTYRIERGHWETPIIFSPEKAERIGGKLMETIGRPPSVPENKPLRIGRNIALTCFTAIMLGLLSASLVEFRWTEGDNARRGYVSCLALLVVCFGLLNDNRLSQWEHSRKIWESTLRTDPASQRALVNLGVYWKKHDRPDKAEWFYKRAAVINPHNPATWHNLALIYLKRRDYPDARKALRKLIEVDPENVGAHLNLGNLCFMEGKHELAEKQYRKIISIAPQNARAWYNLAVLMKQKGRDGLARSYCKKALHIREDFEKARAMCGHGGKIMPKDIP